MNKFSFFLYIIWSLHIWNSADLKIWFYFLFPYFLFFYNYLKVKAELMHALM